MPSALSCIFSFVLFFISACECLNTHTDSWREERQYSNALKEAESALDDAKKLFSSLSFENQEGWKNEGQHSTFSIHTKSTLKTNLTVASMVLDGNIDQIKREIWDRIEELPKWNSIVNSSHILAPLNDNADIFYFVTNDVLMVTGRELLTARMYEKTPKGYSMVLRSINLPEIRERKDKLRANLHLAALRLRPDPSNARKNLCDLAVSVDLKGDLPKDVVKSMMPSIMAIVAELMIKHFKDLGGHL